MKTTLIKFDLKKLKQFFKSPKFTNVRVYKCNDIELQPGECETYKRCSKCPHHIEILIKR